MTPEETRRNAETYVPNAETIADMMYAGAERWSFQRASKEMKELQEAQAVIEKAKAR